MADSYMQDLLECELLLCQAPQSVGNALHTRVVKKAMRPRSLRYMFISHILSGGAI